MKLDKKKDLAAKVLKVGKARVMFVVSRLDEIKEAITRQDIKDLHLDGAIKIKAIRGKKKVVKRKNRRGPGSIKKKVNTRKKDYMTITRKLRKHVAELKRHGALNIAEAIDIRKKIRARNFKSKQNLKDHIKSLEKEKSK